jgi:hypothetical protein
LPINALFLAGTIALKAKHFIASCACLRIVTFKAGISAVEAILRTPVKVLIRRADFPAIALVKQKRRQALLAFR